MSKTPLVTHCPECGTQLHPMLPGGPQRWYVISASPPRTTERVHLEMGDAARLEPHAQLAGCPKCEVEVLSIDRAIYEHRGSS